MDIKEHDIVSIQGVVVSVSKDGELCTVELPDALEPCTTVTVSTRVLRPIHRGRDDA